MALGDTSRSNNLPAAAAGGVPGLTWLGTLFEVWVIAAAVFAVYLPTLHGDFLLDDDKYLTDNTLITGPNNLYRFWVSTAPGDYYPVSNTSLWLEWRLWGMNPTGYHIISILLQIAAAVLVQRVLQRLSIPAHFPRRYCLRCTRSTSNRWLGSRSARACWQLCSF